MNVDGAVPASIEQRLREDQPVGGDYQGVRSRRPHPLDGFFAFEVFRLEHFNAAVGGKTLHGAKNRTQAASGGAIGLS